MESTWARSLPKITISVDVESVRAASDLWLRRGCHRQPAQLRRSSVSFKNLSIGEIVGLIGKIVTQFQRSAAVQEKLPLLDESISDLTSLVTDKVDSLFAQFHTLQADLNDVIEKVVTRSPNSGGHDCPHGESLAAGLVAVGQERQEALFEALSHLQGAIQGLPADFDFVLDGGGQSCFRSPAGFAP